MLQNACTQPVGSCLANQLKDLKTADDALIARGTTPLRYVTRWGGGNPSARQACRLSLSASLRDLHAHRTAMLSSAYTKSSVLLS